MAVSSVLAAARNWDAPSVDPVGEKARVTNGPASAATFALRVGARHDPLERAADELRGGAATRDDGSGAVPAPAIVQDALASPGRPVDPELRAPLESRLGVGLGGVQVHDGPLAAESARAVDAPAYSVGRHVVLDRGAVTGSRGRVIAHELAHVAQARGERAPTLRRYGTPIPTVASPSVTTMRQFIDLVRRIEAENPGKTALQIAQMIMRSKYHSTGFDWLLPSTAGAAGVTASGGVTAADVTTLSGEMTVTLPQGGESDPSHIVTAITAAAETQAPGAGGAGGTAGHLVSNPPPGLTQLDIASWAGDPGSAAGEWATAHPHPTGGTTKQNYMDEFSPESDMIGDVDGVAMTSRSAAAGFVFDPTASLSNNLERFYFPTNPREGKNRRFHTFCAVLGFGLEPDGVTLSAAAIATIDTRIKQFADWYAANDPNITAWMMLHSPSTSSMGGGAFAGPSLPVYDPIWAEWTARANDWHWFAEKFRDFVQRNLRAEGP